jgi:hypothetical protein
MHRLSQRELEVGNPGSLSSLRLSENQQRQNRLVQLATEETTRPYPHKNALAARTKVPTLHQQQTTTL